MVKLRTPRGVHDFLPQEARWKHDVDESIRKLFVQWGYQEVLTPTFEFFETLDLGGAGSEQTYRFLGRDGELLALRSDLTTPIVRMVATRMKHEPKPLRLAYLANVFRYEDVQIGFQREFHQAGVELLGSSTPASDAEVIALAAGVPSGLGVDHFQLDIGHVKYIHGIMEECPNEKEKQQLRQALLDQDFVGLRTILTESSLSQAAKELLMDLPELRGQDDVFDIAYQRTTSTQAREAVDNLRQVYKHLRFYGVADEVYIDFGMLKSLEYYTGMVLEGYVPDLGFTVCSGGRYDELGSTFGMDLPAVGFAFGVERLLLVLERQQHRNARELENVLVVPEDWEQALSYAKSKRELGVQVEVDVQGRTEQEALQYAEEKGIDQVVVVSQDGGRRVSC